MDVIESYVSRRFICGLPTSALWNAGEIERRADALSDVALTIWPYSWSQEAAETTKAENDVTSTLPRLVVFQGKDYQVRSWTDVLVTTLEGIIRVAPDEFNKVLIALPRVVNADPGAHWRPITPEQTAEMRAAPFREHLNAPRTES